MSTPTTPSCPECSGPWLPLHPGGALVFRHRGGLTCSLDVAQASTTDADVRRLQSGALGEAFDREPTAAEVTLAEALGLGTPSSVVVRKVTDGLGVVNRSPVLPLDELVDQGDEVVVLSDTDPNTVEPRPVGPPEPYVPTTTEQEQQTP